MKSWLKKYFGFTQKEIRGLCIFILLIGILIAFPSAYSWFTVHESDAITQVDEKDIQEFLAGMQVSREREPDFPVSPERVIAYFNFNPNELSLEDALRLGLTEKQRQMIQNYVAKGGYFYKKEDFKKIYAISEKDYERLSAYIAIPKRSVSQKSQKSHPPLRDFSSAVKKETIKLSIELNSTDSVELQQLPGIGPVFASRIIRFRDNLGGFYHPDQLLEVYGMEEERFQNIKDHISADEALMKKIPLNSADYESLRKHPFISSKQANAIIQYRKQHGNFTTMEDLSKIMILDEDFLLKIAPYLNFSE